MSPAHHGLVAPLAGILPAPLHAHPSARAASDLLACHARDAHVPLTRSATRHLLGYHRQHDLRVARRTALGDVQPVVGRRAASRGSARRALGWAQVELARGWRRVRASHGTVLFHHGVGGGRAA